MTLHEKLIAIQSELKAPKGQTNAFGKYKYRSCEDILESVKPLLKEHGCTLTLSDSIEMVGPRFYVKATVTLYGEEKSIDGSMHAVSVTAYAREEEDKKGMDGSQITGAASSYARKYALNGLFCIDDTKDSDATNDGKAKPVAPKADAANPEDLAKIKELTESMGGTVEVVYANMTAGRIPNAAQARQILIALNDKKRKLGAVLDSQAAA